MMVDLEGFLLATSSILFDVEIEVGTGAVTVCVGAIFLVPRLL